MSEFMIKFEVNGKSYEVIVKPHWTLLHVLREELGLTGTKFGCGTGECGSCNVLMNGKVVTSCLLPAGQANGKKIVTIEGLSNGTKLHPLQEAFVKYGAVQCGICTPGMIITAKALLDENPNPNEMEVREAMAGNLCRCTGYVKIIEAILSTTKEMKKGE